MNSLDYCHSMYILSFLHNTDSNVVYNGDIVTHCDQYRVSTSLNTDKHICAVRYIRITEDIDITGT